MKKLFFLISSILGSIGMVNAQILPFVEVPDSLNPFLDFFSQLDNFSQHEIEIEDV